MSRRSAKSMNLDGWKRNMITAEIITIGSELLKGSTLNTNSQFLSRELTQLGFSVNLQISCDDQIYAIATHLGQALLRSDVIIVTGGLGPTPDDVTRDALAQYFKVPLLFSKSQYAQIKKLYGRHLLKVPALVRKEAMYPENAVPLINRFGIALGFYIPLRQKILIALPGVPRELESMMISLIKPLLKRFFPDLKTKPKVVARTVGISEPEVMRKLGKCFFKDNFEFGIYPETGEVSLRIYADHPSIIARLSRQIRKKLRDSLYALEEIPLSAAVGKLLQSRKKTLAVAESCTGGLLSAEITKMAGASKYFKGSLTAYSDDIKLALGISKTTLSKRGAVCEEVARGLAVHIRKRMKTDYGIGITGIAGPGGGTAHKPVGLVWISLATPKKVIAHRYIFWGDRTAVQIRASKKALELLWRHLRRKGRI